MALPGPASVGGSDDNNICAQISEFSLNKFARRSSDGNHGRDSSNSDDDSQNCQSGSEFVFRKRSGGDSERAGNVHLSGKMRGLLVVGRFFTGRALF